MTWTPKTRLSTSPSELARQLNDMSGMGMFLSKAEWKVPVLISEVVTFEPMADGAIASLLLIEPFGNGPQHAHVMQPVVWTQFLNTDGTPFSNALKVLNADGEEFTLCEIEDDERELEIMEAWHEFRDLNPGYWEQIVGGFTLGKRI